MTRLQIPDAIERAEFRFRETRLRRAAEQVRQVGPLRRALRRGRSGRAT